MASIAKDKNGTRRILFVAPDGTRKTIRLGRVSQRAAESIKYRVEQLLECLLMNRPMEPDLAGWVADLGPPLAKKPARVGLIPEPEAKAAATLGPFLQAWLAARKGDYKPASLIAWRQVINTLPGFFGADCPLADVSRQRAKPSGNPCWRRACGQPRSTSDCNMPACSLPTPSGKVWWKPTRLSLSVIGRATHPSGGHSSLRPTWNG